MPCTTCQDPGRCDRAGVCQDFGFAPFPRTARAVPLPPTRTEEDLNRHQRELEAEVQRLVSLARWRGFVIEIRTVPLQPLAMGNYEMDWSVRPCRERSQ